MADSRIKHLRRIHFVTGILGVSAFLMTGQYMYWVHHHLQGMDTGMRLLYRTAYIYLLWAALLNLILGSYLQPFKKSFVKLAQGVASVAIVAAPFLIALSFFSESDNANLRRPLCRLGIYLAFAGVLCHALLAYLEGRVDPAENK